MQRQLQKPASTTTDDEQQYTNTTTSAAELPSWSELGEKYDEAIQKPAQNIELTRYGLVLIGLWGLLFGGVGSLLVTPTGGLGFLLLFVGASIGAVMGTQLIGGVNKFSQSYFSLCAGVINGAQVGALASFMAFLFVGINPFESIIGLLFPLVAGVNMILSIALITVLCYAAARTTDIIMSNVC